MIIIIVYYVDLGIRVCVFVCMYNVCIYIRLHSFNVCMREFMFVCVCAWIRVCHLGPHIKILRTPNVTITKINVTIEAVIPHSQVQLHVGGLKPPYCTKYI